MVFLNKEGIVQASAVVMAVSHGDGVFLSYSQTGKGFASVQQPDARITDQISIAFTTGCRSREGLEKVHSAAFASEKASG